MRAVVCYVGVMWEVFPDGPQWALRRTVAGRVWAAFGWALKGGLVAGALAAAFFGFDHLGRAAAGVRVHDGLALTIAVSTGFGAFLGFVMRMLRFRQWVIDRDAGSLALAVRRVFADPDVMEVPLADLERVAIDRRSVVAMFRDGSSETLATAPFGGMTDVARGMRRALRDTTVEVDVHFAE